MDLSTRPSENECFDYHRDYVAKVPDGDILTTLESQISTITQFIGGIPQSQWEIVHPPYGWSIRTVIEHCCDAERVFGYRALRFATGDKTDLPGWDENRYAVCGYGKVVPPVELAVEMGSIRMSNLRLLSRLTDDAWTQKGTADGRSVSVRTLAWLMAGHWLHHDAILRARLAAAS